MNKFLIILFVFFVATPLFAQMKDIKREFYPSGNLFSEVPLEGGVANGILKIFYEDGSLKQESIYIKGKKEGITKIYYKNGSLMEEITYKNDIKEGVQNNYLEDGSLCYSLFYQKGEPISGKKANGNALNTSEFSSFVKGKSVSCK